MPHDLWKDGDVGIPACVLDRNGQVVLGLCKICGQGEYDLAGDCINDFQEGQWWLVELDAMVKDGTSDQKRAVAVVRNLLRTAHSACTSPS